MRNNAIVGAANGSAGAGGAGAAPADDGAHVRACMRAPAASRVELPRCGSARWCTRLLWRRIGAFSYA
jgi:hypothetical protein